MKWISVDKRAEGQSDDRVGRFTSGVMMVLRERSEDSRQIEMGSWRAEAINLQVGV